MLSAFRGTFSVPYQTQSANTAIKALVQPRRNLITRLTNLHFRVGTTANTVVILRPVAYTTTTASAATGQAVLAVTSTTVALDTSGDPETLAGSDYVAWENSRGYVDFDIVASVSSLDVTMTSNLPVTVNSGAKVWYFMEVGRAVHFVAGFAASSTNRLHNSFGLVDSKVTEVEDYHNVNSANGNVSGRHMPLLIYSANATAACFLEHASGYYAAA